MLFLEDFNNFEKFSVMKEDTDRGVRQYKLRGIFSRVNVANKNKRVYPRHIMEEVVKGLQPIIEQGGFVGELDHPPTPKINMDKISHKIINLVITEDGAVVGDMMPAGPEKDKLITLLSDGIRCGVSTRGVGQVRPYNGPLGEGLVEVQPGYQMKAIDIVFDPSAGTYPDVVQEGTDHGIVIAYPSSVKAVWDDIFGAKK